MHKSRKHSVFECESINHLAKKVRQTTWTECSAFKAGSLILLNDSTSGDGAQEYGVLRDGHQIESITVSWMTIPELQELLHKLDQNSLEGVDTGPYAVKPHPIGSCIHCA